MRANDCVSVFPYLQINVDMSSACLSAYVRTPLLGSREHSCCTFIFADRGCYVCTPLPERETGSQSAIASSRICHASLYYPHADPFSSSETEF